jgi:Fic family protein
VEWEPLIPLIETANRAIARFEGALYGVPNPEVLLAPLTTQEAVLSSKIEGTQATLGEVLRFEAGQSPQGEERVRDIQEILNYRRALRHAETTLKDMPFTLNLLLKLHEILLDSVRGRDKGRGRFRTSQNWIGAEGSTMEKAVFVPPSPLQLIEHLSSWEKYYHTDRPDALVQLAVIHAQFEILNPFLDGNGRLGRILVPLFLYERKLLSRPMFYMSEWIEEHKDAYMMHLRALGREPRSWNNWIEFFLKGIAEQAEDNTKKARAIMELYSQLKVRMLALTRSQFAVPLLDQMFARPIFTSAQLMFYPIRPSKPAISSLLRSLRSDGIIDILNEGSGRRGTVFVFAELINLCEGRKVI